MNKDHRAIMRKPAVVGMVVAATAECVWIGIGWGWVLGSEECFQENSSGMASILGLLITASLFNSFLICFMGFVVTTGNPLKKSIQEKVSRSFTLKKAIWFKICAMIMLFVIPDMNLVSENIGYEEYG